MKIFVCAICGEVYIGENIPASCPFCGVENKNLRLAKIWKDTNNVDLTELSRKNLEKALEIELSNTEFYRQCSKKLKNLEVALMFKGLHKVEREHASVFRKILKPKNDPIVNENSPADPLKCVEESNKREKRAVEFYSKAMAEASEPRVKEVFTAIMKTEKDHLSLDAEMREKLQPLIN